MAARFLTLHAAPLGGDAPEWVHLVPIGQIEGRDGRSYTQSDPAAIIATFQERGVDLPIDYEHQSKTHKETRVGPVPVAGWIKDLKVERDDIWGRVDWTTKARDPIAEESYRYRSPVMLHEKGRTEVLGLKGAGLVHHPNLTLTALAFQEDTMDEERPFMHKIAKRLGLADGAGENEVMKTLEDALSDAPDPEKFVPIEAMQSLMDERVKSSESRAQAKIADALSKGHITPGMKEWAMSLCRQNEASFDAFIEKSGRVFAGLMTTSHTRGTPPGSGAEMARAESDLAASVCRQLGLKKNSLEVLSFEGGSRDPALAPSGERCFWCTALESVVMAPRTECPKRFQDLNPVCRCCHEDSCPVSGCSLGLNGARG